MISFRQRQLTTVYRPGAGPALTSSRLLLMIAKRRRPPWLSVHGHQEDMVATVHPPARMAMALGEEEG